MAGGIKKRMTPVDCSIIRTSTRTVVVHARDAAGTSRPEEVRAEGRDACAGPSKAWRQMTGLAWKQHFERYRRNE